MVWGLCYLWRHGGREYLLHASEPDFRVVEIDASAGTARVQQLGRTYTLTCGKACGELQARQSYSGRVGSTDLELNVGGHLIVMPIVKVEFHSDNTPHLLG